MTVAADSQRAGMATIFVFLLAGLLLLLPLKVPNGRVGAGDQDTA